MLVLIVGLVMFLGVHFMRVIPGAREGLQARLGETRYRLFYTAVSLVGFALIIWGKILAHPSEQIWAPPDWGRPLAFVLVPISLILIVASFAPGHIRRWLRHPMLAGVVLWSFGHLMANGELSAFILFGAFFVWSLITFISTWSRDELPPVVKGWGGDLTAVVMGTLAALILINVHMYLFGVAVI